MRNIFDTTYDVTKLCDGIINYNNKWISKKDFPIVISYQFNKPIIPDNLTIYFSYMAYWKNNYGQSVAPVNFKIKLYTTNDIEIPETYIILNKPIITIKFISNILISKVDLVFNSNSGQSLIRIHEIEWYKRIFPNDQFWESVKNDDLDKVKELYSAQYNISLPDKMNKTLLYYALNRNKLDIANFLFLLDKNQELPIYTIFASSNYNSSKYLLELIINNNYTNINMQYLTQLALKNNNIDFIYLLDKHNVVKYNKNQDGYIYKNNLNLIKLMVEKYGANPSAYNNRTTTPLHNASIYGDSETIRYLSKFYKNLNILDEFGRTPVYLSVVYTNTNTLHALLDLNADPNIYDNSIGNYPLHVACFNNHFDIIKILFEHGANPLLKDKSGMPPIILTSDNSIKAYINLEIQKNWAILSNK